MAVDFKDYARRMDKALEHLQEEFGAVRAGRANAKVLDRISVEYYGSETPLNGVATISSPDARTLVIQPWDTKLLKDIAKAIQLSDLGINPQNDGKVIRLTFPQLTEERRKDLTKQVKKYAEDAKVAMRNIRRDGMDYVKKLKKASEITEEAETDAVLLHVLQDFLHVPTQQLHNAAHFFLAALPVLGGESIDRQILDAQGAAVIGDLAEGLTAGSVTGGAGQAAILGPAAIAVHDDGNMLGRRQRRRRLFLNLKHARTSHIIKMMKGAHSAPDANVRSPSVPFPWLPALRQPS